jgi:uncharacterized protein (TIGR02391 family)
MTEAEQNRAKIARGLCTRFLDLKQSTTEHQLLITFADPALLQDMENRTQLRVLNNRTEFLPAVGSFALLGDDDPMYLRAQSAYELITRLAWNLYYTDGDAKEYSFADLKAYANKLCDPNPVDEDHLRLGLYVHKEFSALTPRKMSDDQIRIESFSPSKHVVTMKDDPLAEWNWRMKASRAITSQFGMPISPFPDLGGEELWDLDEEVPDTGLWSLIHPAVSEEAFPRFRNRQYADAVQAALKVVAHAVRTRSGLSEDGSSLMQHAFSEKNPRLRFQDENPHIQKDMQVGYMQIFAGTMTGIRNPKAHALIDVDRRRCIHFLFLASLLVYKTDEAVAVTADVSEATKIL